MLLNGESIICSCPSGFIGIIRRYIKYNKLLFMPICFSRKHLRNSNWNNFKKYTCYRIRRYYWNRDYSYNDWNHYNTNNNNNNYTNNKNNNKIADWCILNNLYFSCINISFSFLSYHGVSQWMILILELLTKRVISINRVFSVKIFF